MYCNILVTKPFDQCFTYKLKTNQFIKRGNVVVTSFGKKKDQIGLVYEVFKTLPKEINKIYSDNPRVSVKKINGLCGM